MLAVYRHDAHKMRGRGHGTAADELAGVPVNQSVPYGADRDAALLSRPPAEPNQTVAGHETHYRLSLLTGETQYDPDTFALHHYEDRLHELLRVRDPETAHRRWLNADLATGFCESVYYPTTSLQYHTLLVAALVDCYRTGATFDKLHLVLDPPDRVVPHRTAYQSDQFAFRLSDDPSGRPAASLGSEPWRSWASTWQRLDAHPLNTVDDRFDMVLDANLRRIQAWSTALQYIDDFTAWRAT